MIYCIYLLVFFNIEYICYNVVYYVFLVCKNGYYGINCGVKCLFLYYGFGCIFWCNCSVNECDNISGCKELLMLILGIIIF